jgi:hypothetical protein
MTSREPTKTVANVTISPPDMRTAAVTLIGTAPLVVNRFSAKAMETMVEKQKAGSTSAKGKARAAKDFDAAMEGARHRSAEGWDGIHAGAFRNALISACRLVAFKMTLAKLSIFIVADGIDIVDGTPLVRIHAGDPETSILPVRNSSGVIDIRPRPMWREWTVDLRVRFDAGQFTLSDVVNLLTRVGEQVGIGEGRADSKSSAGVGWGHFRVEQKETAE